MSRERITELWFLLILGTGCCLPGCARKTPEMKSAKPEAKAESAPTQLASRKSAGVETIKVASANPNESLGLLATNENVKKDTPVSAPQLKEVEAAVERVYEKVASPDTAINPSLVVGDFNGDGFEDLAVAVKPNKDMLVGINNEFANWILEDPRAVLIPGVNSPMRSLSRKPVRAEKGDTLLAIIHGIGLQGWRNPDAKQSFLLKNGAGNNMTAQSAKSLRSSRDKHALPPLNGDAIQQTIRGRSELVYWTGAKYALYSN